MSRALAWTPEEDALLREHYPKVGPTRASAIIGRSVDAVRCRAHKLNLEGFSRGPWTQEEDAQLRDLFPKIGRECFKQIGRSRESVRTRARQMGIAGPGPKLFVKGVGNPALRSRRAGTLEEHRINTALAFSKRKRKVMEKAIEKARSGKKWHSSENATMVIAVQIVAEEQRRTDPVEQAKTLLRRRYPIVVSMAYTAKGGPANEYQVGHKLNVSEQDLLAMAEEVAA